MAKLKYRPVERSEDEESSEEAPTTSPGLGAPEMRPGEVGPSAGVEVAAATTAASSPSRESWDLFASQFEQLLQTTAQLAAVMMEVGAQSRAIIALLERDRVYPHTLSLPTTSQFCANSPIDVTRDSGAILPLGAPPQTDAILHVTREAGDTVHATQQLGAPAPAAPLCVAKGMFEKRAWLGDGRRW
ncbi:unnamed protein product [Lampetra planeri]